MNDLTLKLAADIVAASTANAAESAGALTRAFGSEFSFGEVTQGAYDDDSASANLDGPGLLVLFTVGSSGLALCLPQSTGLLPAWCAAPDATGKSKLATLGQELGMLLLPETIACDGADAQWVESLSAAIRSGGAAADAARVTLVAHCAEMSWPLSLVWPLATPVAAFGAPKPDGTSNDRSPARSSAPAKPLSISELPHYSRSLLKIQLPVSVQLASKKETVKEVVEFVPGSIIKFDKGCDELLQMVIGGQCVAEGEAVKIGDKFGFRVTGLVLPREHFIPVKRRRSGQGAKSANPRQMQGA
jgi:flagellar motor switch/type III secretory pathway protein FliN